MKTFESYTEAWWYLGIAGFLVVLTMLLCGPHAERNLKVFGLGIYVAAVLVLGAAYVAWLA